MVYTLMSLKRSLKCLMIFSLPKESACAENSEGGIEQIFKRRGLERNSSFE
jgi:hypothetical protein